MSYDFYESNLLDNFLKNSKDTLEKIIQKSKKLQRFSIDKFIEKAICENSELIKITTDMIRENKDGNVELDVYCLAEKFYAKQRLTEKRYAYFLYSQANNTARHLEREIIEQGKLYIRIMLSKVEPLIVLKRWSKINEKEQSAALEVYKKKKKNPWKDVLEYFFDKENKKRKIEFGEFLEEI